MHVYVSARDKATIATLPAGIKVADLLRRALAERVACDHAQTTQVCAHCGATLDPDTATSTP